MTFRLVLRMECAPACLLLPLCVSSWRARTEPAYPHPVTVGLARAPASLHRPETHETCTGRVHLAPTDQGIVAFHRHLRAAQGICTGRVAPMSGALHHPRPVAPETCTGHRVQNPPAITPAFAFLLTEFQPPLTDGGITHPGRTAYPTDLMIPWIDAPNPPTRVATFTPRLTAHPE